MHGTKMSDSLTHWLDYNNMQAILYAGYYTSCCIQTWMHTARCISLHAPKYTLKYTPDCTHWRLPACFTIRSQLLSIVHCHPACLLLSRALSRYSQVHSEYAPMYTTIYILMYLPRHPLNNAPNCTQWYTPSLPHCMLPSMLSRCSQAYSQAHSRIHSQLHLMTLPVCLTGCNQVSSQHVPKNTSEYPPELSTQSLSSTLPSTLSQDVLIALDETCSLLGSMLPNTLSRGKTLPISFDFMLPYMLLCAQSRDLLSCSRQAPGWVRLVASSGWLVAGGVCWLKLWHQSISLSEPQL